MTEPWIAAEQASGARKYAPATLRNRDAIAQVLTRHLPETGTVLEVASGSGEHCAFFAERFPDLIWQPSDPDPAALASVREWCRGISNVRRPLALDASAGIWPIEQADAVLCINMVHISPWAATVGLFRGSAQMLSPGGALLLYGPYIEPEVLTAPSNLQFDESLRSRDPEWGLRDTKDIEGLARECGFTRHERVEMPANNLMLIYRRDQGAA